jgi:hypothetical protein
LGQVAVLDDRCSCADSLECLQPVASVGESVLSKFPRDEWTEGVHLIAAEACPSAWQSGNEENDESERSQSARKSLLRKAQALCRTWYAASTSERDRAIIWEEICALDAGMEPRLGFGHCHRDAQL